MGWGQISVDVDLDEVFSQVDTKDLISELSERSLTLDERMTIESMLDPIKDNNRNTNSMTDVKGLPMTIYDEMKMEVLNNLCKKCSLEQLETILINQ